ncbi:hypothetical protein H0H93_016435 [Arthromyces matolae]|nr:hypothetical protein H0H93_016435 [Arthromyces matolae]
MTNAINIIGSDILTKHDPSRWVTLNPHCRIRKTHDYQHPVTIRPLQNSDKLSKPSVEKIQKLMAKLSEPTAKSSYFNERVIFGRDIEVGMLFTVKHEFINEGCRELIPEEDLQRGTLMVLVHNIEEDSKSGQPPRTHIWPFISSQPPASEHVTAILWKANAFGHWGLNVYLDCFLVGNGDSSFYGTWQPQKPKYVHVTYPWYASPNPSHHHSHPLFESEDVKIAARPLKIHANTLQFMHQWQEATHDYNRKEIAKKAASFFASAGGSEGLEAA